MKKLNRKLRKQKTLNIENPIRKATTDGMFKLTKTSTEKYKANLYTLIFTGIGERIMEPEFGTRITPLLFEPIDEDIYDAIEAEVKDAAERWIPEIVIRSVEFKKTDENIENNSVEMKINFNLKNDDSIQEFIEVKVGV